MSDIIIKGMDMPHRCDECFFTDSNDECVFLGIDADMDSVDENCPLVDIPKNHGRLIDGDKLLKKLDEMAREFFNDTFGYLRIDYIADEFNDEPTILDAEGEEE